jgi:hypothetical protein
LYITLGLDDDGQPREATDSFSEMALHVLVERDGDWWLVAGQNTPARPGLSATGDRPAHTT